MGAAAARSKLSARYSMKSPGTILLTGAGGMLGVRLLPHLKKAFEKSRIFSVFHGAGSRVFDTTAVGDLTDEDFLKQVVDESQPDLIINLAALTDVERCESKPELAHRVNIGIPAALVAQAPNAKLLQLSSDYVFDGKSGAYTPDSLPAPLSVYGKTKLESETVTLQNSRNLVARASGTFDWLTTGNLFSYFVARLDEQLKVNALSDSIYSPIWADDLARGIVGLLKQETAGLIHYAGPERMSRYDFALAIADEFGFDKTLIERANQKDFNWKARRPADSSLNSAEGYKQAKVTPHTLAEALAIMREQMEAPVGEIDSRSVS